MIFIYLNWKEYLDSMSIVMNGIFFAVVTVFRRGYNGVSSWFLFTL